MQATTIHLLLRTLAALLCVGLAAPVNAAEVPSAQQVAAPEQTTGPYTYPKPVRLQYDIRGESKGFPYSATAELLWTHDGKAYEARMEINHFLFGSKVQSSSGQITPRGLEPTQFTSKFRGEETASFERIKNTVTFSAKTPDAPLLTGAQDRASIYLQIASMVAGAPGKFPAGSKLPFQTVGERSSESWVFTVGASEKLKLPGGEVSTIRIWQDQVSDNDAKAELWLAPAMDYLPVRIRVSQAGGEFVDQQWRATLKP